MAVWQIPPQLRFQTMATTIVNMILALAVFIGLLFNITKDPVIKHEWKSETKII